MIATPTSTQDIPCAADYADAERLLNEESRRHEALAAVDLWRREFDIFRKTINRIGLDDENEAEKNAFLKIVRAIKDNGHRMLATIEEHGIDTEKECGIRLADLKACVEHIEICESSLFLDPAIEEKLNRYFGVK